MKLSTNQFGCVVRGYPITHPTLKISLKGIQWVDTDATHAISEPSAGRPYRGHHGAQPPHSALLIV
jgi:hypothetical protein